MIADRMRVYRLRWCVFAGWCATHKNGNRIKRIALSRIGGGGGHADLAFTSMLSSNNHNSSLSESRTHYTQAAINAKKLL